MTRASLRLKLTALLNLAILVPMVLYLVWDARLERSSMLDSRIEVMMSVGELVAAQVEADRAPDFPATTDLLDRFHARQPRLEIYLLDRSSRVLVSTHADRLGWTWDEPEIRAAIEGQEPFTWGLMQHGEEPVLDLTLPVAPPGTAQGLPAALHIAEPQARLEQALRDEFLRSTLFVVLLMVLMAGAVTLATDRLIIRRVSRLIHRLVATRWHPSTSEDSGGADELEQLDAVLSSLITEIERATSELHQALTEKEALVQRVEGFNEELSAQVRATREELESVQEELIRKERLSTIGELTAGLAHEIRNPLQIIQGTAEMVRRDHPGTTEPLDDVVEEVMRLNQLVHELLDYARPRRIEPEPVELLRLVERAAAEAGVAAGRCSWCNEIPPELRCWGDETLLHRVLVNLLCNAVQALGDVEGCVTARARTAADGSCCIEVEDDGCGIATEDRDRLFEPFFSRKEAGTGLGLCISRRIVEQHGGTLTVDSERGRGTVVRLTVPATGEDA